MASLTLTEFINQIPKADLHYHLLGGVRLNTMLNFAQKYNQPLTLQEAKTYYRAYQEETGSTKGGIAALTYLYQLMQQPEDYYRVVIEVAEDAKACGLKYIETFWNPSDTILSYDIVNQALVKAIDDAFERWGVVIRLIPSINREKTPEVAVKMVEDMLVHPHPYVLGIGIDYKEINASVEYFWKSYRLAKDAGYKLTAHCSEFGLHWRNVEAGVELINVDRIDHGYSIIENPQLTKRYAESQIPFTVVPSNTFFLHQWPDHNVWKIKHPIRDMAKAGLNLIPCTDDWYMHDTNSTNCYRTMVEDFGFDVLSLKTFMLNSLQASWMNDEIKQQCISSWSKKFDELYQQLNFSHPMSDHDQINYRLPQ